MSELPEQAADATDGAHRYGGAIGIGEPADRHHVNRGHDMCVTYCLTPGQRRRGVRCPSCFGRVAIRALTGDEIEPAGTRWAWWWGAFLGGWAATFRHETALILARPQRKTSTKEKVYADS